MANGSAANNKLIAPAAGAGTGLIFFWLLSLWFGRPFFPHVDGGHPDPMANVERPQAAAPAAPKTVYEKVCITCHQADGKGMPGAFPPLAGSEWVTGDPETPIRIVLLGLGGPIEVAGQSFNAVMPPPVGLTDADIAEAVTHSRTQFGNGASEVTEEQVAAVRATLAGRTKLWTAAELSAMRAAAPQPAANEGAAGGQAPTEEAPTEEAPTEQEAAAAPSAAPAQQAPEAAAKPAADVAKPAPAPQAAPEQEPAP